MKKCISFMMALALLLSIGITAMADDTVPEPENAPLPTSGSITITNPTIGDTYDLYKIFDASYDVDEQGNIKKDGNGNAIIAYTIDENNQFYNELFGATGIGRDLFTVTFSHEDENGVRHYSVVRKELVTKESIVGVLKDMVQNGSFAPTKSTEATASEEGDNADVTVVFSDLPFGYYLIDKGIGAAVTITNNTPDAQVIDKAQKPGGGFDKWVWDDDTEKWVRNSNVAIGDIVQYKIQFIATNYDGEHQVKHYTVHDEKGEAQWVEFNSIKVTVSEFTRDENDVITPGNTLSTSNKGYYHFAGDPNNAANTDEWDHIGDKDPDNTYWDGTEDDADWYLLHQTFDHFHIVIPWMTDHDFTGTTNDYTLTYGENAKSKYPSSVLVTVEYTASVEPSATIGPAQNNNLWNTANLRWTSNITTGGESKTTQLQVEALALRKIDEDTEDPLEGAVFKLWRDADCTKAVYVIPTDIEGVYMVDDLNTEVSGQKRESARKLYEKYLADYLGTAIQKNEVVTPVNGKVVILGLEAGDYYLQETKAPNGYNVLAGTTMVSVGQSYEPFFVIADDEGKVYKLNNAEKSNQKKINYTATVATVGNNRGVELPSTGGEGTMMLITIGTVIALAFAVLLITHKKMSVYSD